MQEHGSGKGNKVEQQTDSHPSQGAAAAFTIPPKPPVYSYSCKNPRNAEQANLCIERGAAESADKWGGRTFWVGVASALGLILTLIATAWAAIAAGRSAGAAEEAITKSDELLEHSRTIAARDGEVEYRRERPYLFMGLKEESFKIGPYGHATFIAIKNSGRTPAFLKKAWGIYYPVEPFELKNPHMGAQWHFVDFVWAAGEENSPVAFVSPFPNCWLCVAIEYEDIFKRSHFSRSIYRIDAAKETIKAGAIIANFSNEYWNDWD